MSTPRPVGRLHVLTASLEMARLAAAGGADTVQFRDKRACAASELVDSGRRLRAWLHERGVPFIVNDRVDLALLVDADGVHLGADDMPVGQARLALGPAAIIGRTANSYAEALRAAAEPVNYLGVGPVFATSSKTQPAAVLGLEELRRIAAAVPLPVIAIGGIDAARLPAVLATGVHGVAVLSAVAGAADPLREVLRMREAIEGVHARVG